MGKRSIAAAAFKTKCLALLDEVQHEQKEIVITKRGKPVRSWYRCGRLRRHCLGG
jgi:hypothetical protein